MLNEQASRMLSLLTLSKVMQTTAQAIRCFQLCCDLTSKYCSVDLVRLDKRTRNVVILSGEEINIEIKLDGEWRFV
ncbi:MAG: hypothetical protein C4288_13420 [Leptolyngbya sp. ERB_1_1]